VELPFVTADQPGIGGIVRESFEVIEEPAYSPSGTGDHVYALIEKRDLTTPFAIAQIAKALALNVRDIGYAGMKDRRAVTRQWVSLPPPVQPAQVLELTVPGLRVLDAMRHPHKLRTGHLRANRFVLVVRRTVTDAATRAESLLTTLAEAPGAPNWYGEQRFGRAGDNAAQGLALMRKQRRFDRDPRKNRLLLSALQSELFNQWLAERIQDGWFRHVIEGDVLRKLSGGQFVCSEPAVDELRLLRGEVVTTGPMFGVEMRSPPEHSAAALREASVLAAALVQLDEFAFVRNIAPGARRDAAIAISDWKVDSLKDDAVRISFTLPAGAYATAVLRELQKPRIEQPVSDDSPPITTDDIEEQLKEQPWT
jgi:tRNA pseudouridine13 synthase